MNSKEILQLTPVLPVVKIDDLAWAVPLARALKAGGVGVLEVVLRTPVSLQAIRAIKEWVPEVIVGAGTVINAQQLAAAIEAGSEFVVTPGLTKELLEAGMDAAVPLIPGVATASEVMVAMQAGLSTFKFFPAASSGGPAAIKALSAPFADARFCPTGGISESNMGDYLNIDSVLCVGGSWLASAQLMAAGDWAGITDLAVRSVQKAAELNIESDPSL